MVKDNRPTPDGAPEAVISIVGVGMTVKGDCETDGALRIDGTVNGHVRASKAVVVGKEGLVDGHIYTEDAMIAGRVLGSVHAVSRLEVRSTGYVSGDVMARFMHLGGGANLTAQVSVGESQAPSSRQVSAEKRSAPVVAAAVGGRRPVISPASGLGATP